MTPDCPMSPDDNEATELTCKWMGCGLSFDTLEELVSHLTASHVTSQHGAFYCLWRGCTRTKGFNARYKMLIHIRTHTNERPYVCCECDKRFSRQENLRIHARTHTGEKPYVCTVPGCGKAYSNSSDRFKHTRTHFVDKPYECRHPGCGKRYTDPSSLRKHVKIYGHSKRQEEVSSSTHFSMSNSSGVPESVEQALAQARLDLSPSPCSSVSSLGPSPVPSNPSPSLLAPSLFHSAAAANSAAAAVAVSAAGLGAVGLSPWAPVTATASFGAVTAAAAWTVALHQYQAGLLLSSGKGLGRSLSMKDHIIEEADEESEDETPTASALDLSMCSSPLDLSLPSSRSRKH